MNEPIVILGPSDNVVAAAKRLDRPLILVGANPNIAQQLDSPYDESFEVDFTSPEALSSFCSQVLSYRRVSAVASLTEGGQMAAARARELLGLPGLSLDVVRRTVDKLEMRRCLTERAPQVTVPAVPASRPDECRVLLETHGTLVGKPTSGTGSAGFTLLENNDELEKYLANCKDSENEYFVEPFVDGKEYTVETFSVDGHRTHVAIVEKWVSGEKVELAHLFSESISADVRTRIELAVTLALDALEVDSGATCTEVLVSQLGVTVIETHTRPGGDGLADLIHIVSGIDWRASAFEAMLRGSLIRDEPSAVAAGIVFWTAPAGRVTAVRREPPLLPATVRRWLVLPEVGEFVRPLRSSEDRLGAALISAATAEACRFSIESLLEEQIVKTVPDSER